jgi:hypothetical protein
MIQGAQQARGVLRALLTLPGTSGVGAATAAGAAVSVAASHHSSPSPSSPAHYSSWEGHWSTPRRTQTYREVNAVRSMLPHRTHLVPQFSAHGVALVPETLLLLQQQPVVLQRDDVEEEGAAATAAGALDERSTATLDCRAAPDDMAADAAALAPADAAEQLAAAPADASSGRQRAAAGGKVGKRGAAQRLRRQEP